MKRKIILTIAIIITAVYGFSQSGKSVIHTLADTSKYFTSPVSIGDFVYNQATKTTYVSKINIGVTAHKKLSYLLSSSSYYALPAFPGSSVTTSGDITCGGNLSVTGTSTFGTETATTSNITTANITTIQSTGSLVADTAHFGTLASGSRNKYIRKKITGIKTTDVFVVSQIMTATGGTPGTEILGWYIPSADSLVIARSAATTSGLAVSFHRINK